MTEEVVHKVSITIPAQPVVPATTAITPQQMGRTHCEVCGGPVLPNVFHVCPKPEVTISEGRTHCEACLEQVFPDVAHHCPPGNVEVMNQLDEKLNSPPAFSPDECQCVWRGANSAELWLGNKVGARSFPYDVLCVLEEPHCEQAQREQHIHIMVGPYAARSKLDQAAEYIDAKMAAGAVLLVHCGAGMERSPLTIGWWMCRSGIAKSFPEAYAMMQAVRPIVQNREAWICPAGYEAEAVQRAEVDKELASLSEEQIDERLVANAAKAEFATKIEGEPTAEQVKYEKMWGFDQYRGVAPGETAATHFLQVARPRRGSRVIDFGAGTGRGGMMLAILNGMQVDMVDFASNSLDTEVRAMLVTQKQSLRFFQADLSKAFPHSLGAAEYGFCTDVMEHIPEGEVDIVLKNVLMKARHVYFQISTVDDSCGTLIGEKLHLSVHDSTWWLKKFQSLDAQVHYFSADQGAVTAYVTAWSSGQEMVDAGVLNVELETIRANVRTNMAAGWKQIEPHMANDIELCILGGGPSLNGQLEAVRSMREDMGAKIVTLNGAYHWALEHGLQVGSQILCDARPFNARFTHPVDPLANYLVGSQCDPSVLEGLPRERTWLWHTTAEDIKDVLDEFGPDKWYGVQGGCTVLTRALPLLRMLGYSQFHLFGCDSCLLEFEDERTPAHHAYVQSENDDQVILEVVYGGRRFLCHPWMLSQAQEFISLVRSQWGELFKIQVHGGGLLAWILEHGADADLEAEQTTELQRRQAARPVV